LLGGGGGAPCRALPRGSKPPDPGKETSGESPPARAAPCGGGARGAPDPGAAAPRRAIKAARASTGAGGRGWPASAARVRVLRLADAPRRRCVGTEKVCWPNSEDVQARCDAGFCWRYCRRSAAGLRGQGARASGGRIGGAPVGAGQLCSSWGGWLVQFARRLR